MKILHVIQRYWPYVGGSERYFQEISERFAHDGHEVSVVTTDAWDLEHFWAKGKRTIDTPQDTHNGVHIRRIPVRHLPFSPLAYPVTRRLMSHMSQVPMSLTGALLAVSKYTPWVPELDKTLAQSGVDFDVVHATNIPFDSLIYSAFRFAKKRKIPFIITPFVHLGEPHDNRIRKYYSMRHQIHLMAESDAVFVQTDLERDFLIQMGVPPPKMMKTSIGVNIDEVIGGQAERFRKKYDITEPIVFYVGITAYDKGTVHLVEAMRRLWRQGVAATLVLAGPTMDHFMKYYTTLSEEETKRCRVLGFVSEEDKKDLFAAGDVFAMPSRTDSFGIVFLEAWLYNKPVIGARAGGVPEVVDHDENGYLVGFGDVPALAESISNLLNDRATASTMGLNGESKVRNNYLWDIVYDRINEIYTRLRENG